MGSKTPLVEIDGFRRTHAKGVDTSFWLRNLWMIPSVYGLTWVANKYRVKAINLQEQFIMAYGGLRGAVGFSLVEMISREDVPSFIRRLFVTTTLTIVTFTIFFQVSDLFFSFKIFSHFKNNQ